PRAVPPAPAAPVQPREAPAQPAPTAAEFLSAEDLKECKGVVEMHPDGYAFLRTSGLLSSSADIYVAAAQIKRFRLRSGDLITGKVRPQREGDKFGALLTVGTINGQLAESLANRPAFESMTAVYPNRPINLTPADPRIRTTRILELIAPMGFGQRVLMLCQPDSGKAPFLRDLANAISKNHPDAAVMAVLLDENPEDVTLFRDAVTCQVYATTFDQNPDNHLRLSELALERAERLVEQGRDVVLLMDSLTRLSKACPLTAAQQGRAVPGSIIPSSLYRAKRVFGAARALREGGSLTVIGTLNISTGNKIDDSIVEEFREAANSTIFLDNNLARVGVRPTISFHQSGTRRQDGFVQEGRREGLRILRKELNAMSDSAAMKELNDLADQTADNDVLFTRLPEWMAIIEGKKGS
nr:transcription termination factor Rho [Clostridiales bacterium]